MIVRIRDGKPFAEYKAADGSWRRAEIELLHKDGFVLLCRDFDDLVSAVIDICLDQGKADFLV